MGASVVIAPHPDDEVLGCSAVLSNASVSVVHVTDGVPPWTAPQDRDDLRSTRQSESERAWRSLSSRVDLLRLGFGDLAAWQSVDQLAESLAGVVDLLRPDRVYLPAFQRGHPDHDASYIAGALARKDLGSRSEASWWIYGLYGFDSDRRLRFGWLPPDTYGPTEVRADDPRILAAKGRALRDFTSQNWSGSALDLWLREPTSENFAPLPDHWEALPDLPSFYDEVLGFAKHGASGATVEAVFRKVLDARAG